MCRFDTERGRSFGPRSSQNGYAIVLSALRDLAAGLENDELLAGDQSEHSVRRGIGIFDEATVDGERLPFKRVRSIMYGIPSSSLIGEEVVVNRRDLSTASEDRTKAEGRGTGAASFVWAGSWFLLPH
jgi:hypothetical protein